MDIALPVIITLTVFTVINIIVPLPGFSILAPLLFIFYDEHTTITLLVFSFLFLAGSRAIIFVQDIQWGSVRELLIVSLIGAFIGTTFASLISGKMLAFIIFIYSLYFIIEKITPRIVIPKQNPYAGFFVGLLSGIGKTVGTGGSFLITYLYSRGLTTRQIQGTSGAIDTIIFGASMLIRSSLEHTDQILLINILWITPLFILATLIGRFALVRIDQEIANKLLLGAVILSLFPLIQTLLK